MEFQSSIHDSPRALEEYPTHPEPDSNMWAIFTDHNAHPREAVESWMMVMGIRFDVEC